MRTEKSHKSESGYWALIVLVSVVIAIWATSGLVLFSVKDRGTFGDMFGAINALFSGLAFATLIYTMHLQRKELALQREELEATRIEIRGQKEQLATQNEVLRTQNFENTFFQLLDLLLQIRESFNFSPVGTSTKSIKAFEYAYSHLKNKFENELSNGISNGKTKEDVANLISTAFFEKHQDDFGHYFRTLYNLIKLVKKTDAIDKRFYTNLIRSQISNDEITIIFYDCLSNLGKEKFKPLLEEFSFLKVIKPEMLIDKNHYSLYAEKAYH